MSKYRARKLKVDDVTFDSQAEADRYGELCILQLAGEIADLRVQPKWVLQPAFRGPDGKTVRAITYSADFSYTDAATGRVVVEDVKPAWKDRKDGSWAVFRLKTKMLLRVHGVSVTVVER